MVTCCSVLVGKTIQIWNMMHWRETQIFFATQNKTSIPLPWDCLYRRHLPTRLVESPFPPLHFSWRVPVPSIFTNAPCGTPSPFIPNREEYLFRRYLPACPAESPPPVIYQRPAETPTVSTRCRVIRYSSMPRIWHTILSSISCLYKRFSIDPVARFMSISSINRLPLILNIPLCVVKAVLKRLCKELTHDVAAGGKRSSTELWYLPPVLLAWLCCLTICAAWLTVCMTYFVAWTTLLLDSLCCLTHYTAWLTVLLDSLGLTDCAAWLGVFLDSLRCLAHCVSGLTFLFYSRCCLTQGASNTLGLTDCAAWLTALLSWLCSFICYADWPTVLFDALRYMPDCDAWLTVLLDSLFCFTHCVAWLTVVDWLCCLTHCAAWLTVLLDSPFCLTHCVSWLTALLGSLCYLTHSVAGLIVLLDSLRLTDSNEANMAIRGLDGWSKQRSRLGIHVTYWRGWFSARRDTSIISVDYLMVSFPPCLFGTKITVTFTR